MSFRPVSSIFYRAGIAGFVCLALVVVSRGGEGARNIEVVPLHGTTMDTNFDESSPADSPAAFKAWLPRAPQTIQLPQGPPRTMMPPPRPRTTVDSDREKELQDRRRNWVFMTPEDYASPDQKKDGLEKDDGNKKSGTAMERFYQRMYDSEQVSATNQFGALDSDRLIGRTNLLNGDARNSPGGVFSEAPVTPNPEIQIFQSVQRNGFASVFNSDSSENLRSPEAIRAEAEQKAHMESFKQLWNIDQPPAAAPVASSPTPTVDSGPLFGLSAPGMSSATPANSFDGGSSSALQTPVAAPAALPRSSRPPHADFLPPQRPF